MRGLCDVLCGLRVANGRAKASFWPSVSVDQFWVSRFQEALLFPMVVLGQYAAVHAGG
jgi:hypothetical protein